VWCHLPETGVIGALWVSTLPQVASKMAEHGASMTTVSRTRRRRRMSAPRSRARQRAPGRGLVWASPSLAASSLPLAKPSSCGAGRGAAPPGGESAGRLSLVGPRCRWRRAATASRAGLGCHAPVARGHRGRWTSDGGRGSAPPPAPSAARAPTGSQRSSALPQKRSSRARKKKGRRGGGV
jgi:hypothetical protein